MLQLKIPLEPERWDEENEEFIEPRTMTLQLEHSLVSISKWESKWCKAFLSKRNKTHEEVLDYIKCMTLTQNVNPEIYNFLTVDNLTQIHDYIDSPMTATHLTGDKGGGRNNEVVTSELIYYWMISLNIPFECQKWHLNRLLALIKVCNAKNSPRRKRSLIEIAKDYSSLNAARRKQFNTKG